MDDFSVSAPLIFPPSSSTVSRSVTRITASRRLSLIPAAFKSSRYADSFALLVSFFVCSSLYSSNSLLTLSCLSFQPSSPLAFRSSSSFCTPGSFSASALYFDSSPFSPSTVSECASMMVSICSSDSPMPLRSRRVSAIVQSPFLRCRFLGTTVV